MTPEQIRRIREAMANGLRSPRTPGTRIRAALSHAKQSETKKPDTVRSGAGLRSASNAVDITKYTAPR